VPHRENWLRDYLRKTVERQRPFNQLLALWALSRLAAFLSDQQRAAILGVTQRLRRPGVVGRSPRRRPIARRRNDARFGKRRVRDGLVALGIQRAGKPAGDPQLSKALAWLRAHQNAAGMWKASSLNKNRDPASDAGKFMTDAATACAALALVQAP
jgi:squalene-hopene/tetraprenyl-beta-curcumene cyclase